MQLTTEQKQAIERGETVRVEADGVECVILRADIFERVQSLGSDAWTHDEMDTLAAEAADRLDHAERIE